MDAQQLLPHVEEGCIVVDEGTDLVNDHQEDGNVHGPGVWKSTIHIACKQQMQ